MRLYLAEYSFLEGMSSKDRGIRALRSLAHLNVSAPLACIHAVCYHVSPSGSEADAADHPGTVEEGVQELAADAALAKRVWCRSLCCETLFEIEDDEKGTIMDVEAKVKEIIVQQLGVDAGKVTADASFVDDLGADSLDVVELVMAFEEEFSVEIPDEAAEKIATVKDANEFLKANLSS